MKAIAFNGSARIDGNTAFLLKVALDEIEKEGIETEIYHLAGKSIQGCIACYRCFKNKNRRCANEEDIINECIAKMLESNAILLGSPTYFSNVSTNMKALIERAGMVARANNDMFKRKVGAGVVAVRRAGAAHVFSSINYFFLIGQMIIPGSSYWNIAIGKEPKEVQKDTEGIETIKTLGQNIAWLLKKLYS